MQEPSTWRELLGAIIQNPQERLRIAKELGVHPLTLTRWVNNESTPRQQNLRNLPNTIPEHRVILTELITKDIADFPPTSSDEEEGTSEGVPFEFYERILRTRAILPRVLRFSSLTELILQQALVQFDPHRLGLSIIIARCMPPSPENQILSLRENVGRGTPPWESDLGPEGILLGAESLVGYAVTVGQWIVNQNLREEGYRSPGYRGQWEESAVACPITYEGAIAGALLVSSTQANYFLPSRIRLVQSYADLLALAFEPEEFYAPERIKLRLVPPQDVQRPYLSNFRQRLLETMKRGLKSGQ